MKQWTFNEVGGAAWYGGEERDYDQPAGHVIKLYTIYTVIVNFSYDITVAIACSNKAFNEMGGASI